MILPDTSIWIDYLRGKSPYFQILRHHLEQRTIATTGPIFAELLQGAKSEREVREISDFFAALPKFETTSELWLHTGIFAQARRTHANGISIVDVSIIMAARRHGARVWSRDKALLSLLKKEEKFHARK